jgi:hypothetical protein
MQTSAVSLHQPAGLFLALTGAALLLACGGNPPEQSSGGLSRATPALPDSAATLPTESCGLLTAREVAALTGRPVRQQAQGAACLFVEVGNGGTPNAVVLVSFRPAAAFQTAQAGNALKRHGVEQVPGLGHEAYYDDDHGDLYVRLPERTLVIGMPRRIKDHPRQRLAPELGRLAVARLTASPNAATQ